MTTKTEDIREPKFNLVLSKVAGLRPAKSSNESNGYYDIKDDAGNVIEKASIPSLGLNFSIDFSKLWSECLGNFDDFTQELMKTVASKMIIVWQNANRKRFASLRKTAKEHPETIITLEVSKERKAGIKLVGIEQVKKGVSDGTITPEELIAYAESLK